MKKKRRKKSWLNLKNSKMKSLDSRIQLKINKKNITKKPRTKMKQVKEWGLILKYTRPRELLWNFKKELGLNLKNQKTKSLDWRIKLKIK
jgi:hypothetical protein